MENNFLFYLCEGIASSNPEQNLKSKLRIMAVPENFPHKPNGIGHKSLRHLRKYETRWKELNSKSSKIANKICEHRFILWEHDFVLTPTNDKFNEYSYDLLNHTVHGDFDKEFKGIHLISKINKK